jgi:hypothetical protein
LCGGAPVAAHVGVNICLAAYNISFVWYIFNAMNKPYDDSRVAPEAAPPNEAGGGAENGRKGKCTGYERSGIFSSECKACGASSKQACVDGQKSADAEVAKSKARADRGRNGRKSERTVWDRAENLLCWDPCMALYICVTMFSFVWQVVGFAGWFEACEAGPYPALGAGATIVAAFLLCFTGGGLFIFLFFVFDESCKRNECNAGCEAVCCCRCCETENERRERESRNTLFSLCFGGGNNRQQPAQRRNNNSGCAVM